MDDMARAFMEYPALQRALAACLFCGFGCSLLSVFVTLLRMPLIGVAMSHAAFAGAVGGMLIGINPVASGFALCLLAAALIGPFADRADTSPENALGIVFSFLMGAAFLGMGVLTRSHAGALNLMWGSLLSIRAWHVWALAGISAAVLLFVVLLFKEIRCVLYNRRLAASAGVPERAIYYALLLLTGATVSVNLTTVGGLLIFALLVQPGATASQLTYNLKWFFVISACAGVTACLGGLIISGLFDLPSGACVVMASTALFALAFAASPKRRAARRHH
jgi:manganese/iron transport system permease protein